MATTEAILSNEVGAIDPFDFAQGKLSIALLCSRFAACHAEVLQRRVRSVARRPQSDGYSPTAPPNRAVGKGGVSRLQQHIRLKSPRGNFPEKSGMFPDRQNVVNYVKGSSITSSDSFNLSSARLNKPQGLDLR